MERLLEELSFEAPDMKMGRVAINAAYVNERLERADPGRGFEQISYYKAASVGPIKPRPVVAPEGPMEPLKILLLCVDAAVVYGILHDSVTARVCVEYFTVGHPPVFDTDSPTLLAFGWGFIATWWVGFILGILAIAACRLGAGRNATPGG